MAVAVADEGAELRKAGITMPIIVMNPEMGTFDTLFKYNLEPEVYNFRLLEALTKSASSQGITNFPIHIKIDSVSHRLWIGELFYRALPQMLRHATPSFPRADARLTARGRAQGVHFRAAFFSKKGKTQTKS